MATRQSSGMRESMKSYTKEEPKTSIAVATFSVVSVTIGAGMVAVPNSAFNSGIPWSIAYNIFNFIACIYSIHLYIRWAEVTGHYSMPKIGYEVMGRFSLYLVNFLQIIVFWLLPVSYFIIFANLLRSFFLEINWVKEHAADTIAGQWFSVLILAVLIFPLIIKKKIAELKLAGMLLFTTVILFIILMFVLKFFNSGSIHNEAPITQKAFYRFSLDKAFFSSLSTAFVAYGFQSAFFPIYNSLKKKEYREGMKFTLYGMSFCFIIYVLIMFIALYSFGFNVNGDVLENVEEVKAWESYVLRVLFLLVLATHLPFIFFVGKESVLAIIALIYIRGDAQREINRSIFVEEKDDSPTQDKKKAAKEEEIGLLNTNRVNDVNGEARDRNSLNQMEVCDQIISGTAERSIERAIPFADKHQKKVTVMGSLADVENDVETGTDLLPNWIYYTTTLILYGLIVATSCFLSDAEMVLKFVGSMANAFLNFTFPGLFYFIIMRRYKVGKQWWKLTLALSLAIYGTVMGMFLTGVNVWTTISPLDRKIEDFR